MAHMESFPPTSKNRFVYPATLHFFGVASRGSSGARVLTHAVVTQAAILGFIGWWAGCFMDGWFQVELSESTFQTSAFPKLRFRPRTLQWTNNKKTAFPRCFLRLEKGWKSSKKTRKLSLNLEAFFGHPKTPCWIILEARRFPDPQLTPQYCLQCQGSTTSVPGEQREAFCSAIISHQLQDSSVKRLRSPPRRFGWTLDIWRWYGKGDQTVYLCLYISNIQIYIYIYIFFSFLMNVW